MSAILLLSVLSSTAIANRIRGGGFGIEKYRLGIAALMVFLVSTAVNLGWHAAAAITVAYVFWDSIGPWGRWLTMNNHPRSISGDPNWFEKIVENIAGDSDFVAMTIRMYVGILGFSLVAFYFQPAALWLSSIAPIAMAASYWLTWKAMPLNKGYDAQVHVSEMMVGLIWGFLIISLI